MRGCFFPVSFLGVKRSCFWLLLVLASRTLVELLTKEISGDTSKKGVGTYPVDFHEVAAAAAAAAAEVGPFAGVFSGPSRSLGITTGHHQAVSARGGSGCPPLAVRSVRRTAVLRLTD